MLSTLNEHPKSRFTQHTMGLSLVIKPEITSTAAMLITNDLASPSRRAMSARKRGVPFVLAQDFRAPRQGQTVDGVREGLT